MKLPIATVMVLIVVVVTACPPAKVPVPDASDASEDDALEGGARSRCRAACAKLAALGCPEAATPDGGKACADVCADNEASPKLPSFKPACVAAARDVAAVRACGSVRCTGG